MLRILDRYVIREVLPPFVIALLVLTFVLEIPPIIQQGEKLIAKGASWGVVSRVLITLLPQALGITIPMALLIGILIALGRLSGDREAVALQACGASPLRLLRPLGALAIAAWAATMYVMIVAVPAANQAFREIAFKVVATRAESEVKPRVFFEDFPNVVLYVRSVSADAWWQDVFVADTARPDELVVYLAPRGRILLDADTRSVQMLLENGGSHRVDVRQPEKYQVTDFQRLVLRLDPEAVFPREGPLKGDREMTVAELKARMAELRRQGISTHNQVIAIQQKFSIPVACLVFGVIGLGLGISNRRDGKLASFVLGTGVIFLYYVIMYMGQSMAKGAIVPAWLAMWLPNVGLGAAGIAILWRRTRSVERPIFIALPFRRRLPETAAPATARIEGVGTSRKTPRLALVVRMPRLDLPRLNILDWYVSKLCLRVVLLAGASLLALFYISTFIDLSDKLFKGTATGGMVLHYLWLATPQFVYFIIPMAVLIGALVTIGALTKNSELVVMKACGISLYRAAAPLLLFAALASSVLFLLEERVLAYANRSAEAIRHVIRGGSPRTFDVLNRKWVVGRDGTIYHYAFFDPRRNELNGLSIYQFHPQTRGFARRSYFARAVYQGGSPGQDGAAGWEGQQGWVREFGTTVDPARRYDTFGRRELAIEPPGYFMTEQPDAERMTYTQLRRYVAELRASGFDVVPYAVALERKLSFPFVTLIMTLIAVPFGVTTGRRGALYGVGTGIVLAMVYWTAISIFAAIGSGGLLPPILAAWAPNLLFGAVAAYLVLTVRT